MSKAILIFGATGKQGGAVLRALLAHSSFSPTTYTVLAATRNVDSPGSQRLAALSPAIKLVKGDVNDAAGTFKDLPTKPWGVYAMTMPGKRETEQGISIADEAVKAGAQRFVFSSVDRGPAEGRNSATNVPHFITKHNIEAHLRKLAAESAGNFTYTIIRPPFFLDNLEPGFLGRVFTTMWRDNCTRPMSVVDTRDIGKYGAAAFLEADSPAYANASLNIAGDRLTFDELSAKFQAKTGHPVPTTYSFFASLLIWMVHDVKEMAKFFQEPGFAAMPEESNRLQKMNDVDSWLDQSKHLKKEN